MATFGNLSERLADTFKNLRGKGRLSPADVDGTVREIRRALLDADVALDVVKDFTGRVRDRALGDEVSKALNPAQQVVQIVNDELIQILGGEARRIQFAKTGPTVDNGKRYDYLLIRGGSWTKAELRNPGAASDHLAVRAHAVIPKTPTPTH